MHTYLVHALEVYNFQAKASSTPVHEPNYVQNPFELKSEKNWVEPRGMASIRNKLDRMKHVFRNLLVSRAFVKKVA